MPKICNPICITQDTVKGFTLTVIRFMEVRSSGHLDSLSFSYLPLTVSLLIPYFFCSLLQASCFLVSAAWIWLPLSCYLPQVACLLLPTCPPLPLACHFIHLKWNKHSKRKSLFTFFMVNFSTNNSWKNDDNLMKNSFAITKIMKFSTNPPKLSFYILFCFTKICYQ